MATVKPSPGDVPATANADEEALGGAAEEEAVFGQTGPSQGALGRLGGVAEDAEEAVHGFQVPVAQQLVAAVLKVVEETQQGAEVWTCVGGALEGLGGLAGQLGSDPQVIAQPL